MAIKAMVFCFLLCTSAVYAADHTVGGTSGWNFGPDYTGWATSQKFIVGDNLVFSYGLSHNVVEVDKSGYDNCDGSNGTPHNSGPTTIALTSTGSKYFICSRSDHCSSGGMKLAVTVTAATSPGGTPPPSGTPPTTPSTPSTPSTPTTPDTPPSPTPPSSGESPTTTLPPPPPSGATRSFGSLNSFLVGSSLVLVTVFAFMG